MEHKNDLARLVVAASGILVPILLAGCNPVPFFALGGENEEYSQEVVFYNNKVDIIWMVDGSATMANHQDNLANNFGSFVNEFSSKDFDYQMVFAATDAWVREHEYDFAPCRDQRNQERNPRFPYVSSADCKPTLATVHDLTVFRDGDIYGNSQGEAGIRSGVYILNSLMNLATVDSYFKTNIRLGLRGDGTREAGFQSLRAVLRRNADGSPGYGGETHTVLDHFRRPDAFLSVIMISDEEDQSKKPDGSDYANVNDYVTNFTRFLNGYAGQGGGTPWYSVNSIVVDDIENCDYGLNGQASQGDRYVAIAEATGGVVGNICSPDFSNKLSEIAKKVVTLLSRFRLKREPLIETIEVIVNGVVIPQSETNGWTYRQDQDGYFVHFHGTAIPPKDASIILNYDPKTLR